MLLAQLRNKRADLIAQMESLNTLAINENRDFTAEETSKYESLNAEQTSLKSQIVRLENQEKLNAEMSSATTAPIHAPAIVSMKDNQVLDETGFKDIADFMGAVSGGRDSRLSNFEATQNMGTGSAGGFSVPEHFVETIMVAYAPEGAIVRPRATIIPAGEFPDAKIKLPALDQSGDKGVYSGVVTKWLEEGGTISKTSFSLRQIEMESKALAAYVPITNKMLRNNGQMATFGTSLIRQALMKAEDDAFIGGDGVGKPLGFKNHASSKAINRATANTVTYADLVNMLQASNGDMKEWVISQTLIATILSMADASGKLIYTNGITGMSGMILGYPVRWSERTPTEGSKGDVMLLDLSKYYIKEGSGIIVEASSQYQFLEDNTVFKVISNVDGQSSMNSTLKLENGETVSPFVILDVPKA